MKLFVLLSLVFISSAYSGSFSAVNSGPCGAEEAEKSDCTEEIKEVPKKKLKVGSKNWKLMIERSLTVPDDDTDAWRTEVNEWARMIQPHPIPTPLAPPLPRIHVADLELPENVEYKNRAKPFVLTGAMEGWKAFEQWPFDSRGKDTSYLAKKFPRAVCDFYPYNMLENTSPYLIRLPAGVDELMKPPGRFTDSVDKHKWACTDGCRYLHLQLTPNMWKELEDEGGIAKKRHTHLEGDQWWMRRCLKQNDVREEFHLKTHWKIILTGSKGAGMFNHTDSLLTSSWHGHVQGRKWWYVCGRDMSVSGDFIGSSHCYETTLYPGEVLYYGRSWWHHTRNLDTPTMTVTGTVVNSYNFEYISEKLYGECTSAAMSFDFSGALCDALDQCYTVWHKNFKGREPAPGKWKPWREVASASEIAKKDARKATDNNYDGRNYISE